MHMPPRPRTRRATLAALNHPRPRANCGSHSLFPRTAPPGRRAGHSRCRASLRGRPSRHTASTTPSPLAFRCRCRRRLLLPRCCLVARCAVSGPMRRDLARDADVHAAPGGEDKPERSPAAPVSLTGDARSGAKCVRHLLLTRSPSAAGCGRLDARQAICGSHHRPSIARPCQPCNMANMYSTLPC